MGPGASATDNLAIEGRFVSPVTRRPLRRDVGSGFSTADGAETYGCVGGDIPDFRPGGVPLAAADVAALQTRLEDWWQESDAGPVPAQRLVEAEAADAWRYWRLTATSETRAFIGWWVGGRHPLTQRDSMALYRTVTDVYPRALRRSITVLADGRVATVPLAEFKRLSLEPVIELIRRERVRSVLDFGCGWGVNTIILRQLFPELQIWSFDYSPERTLATQFNLRRLGLVPYRLFVADGSRLPLADGGIDLVFTTHVLEQMREMLSPALAEIHRVAARFACHTEPTWRWGAWPHRLRMRRLGYAVDILERALALGWRLREHRPASPGWGRLPGELFVLER
jgi:SAM-dependent methyltransferase